MRMMTTASRKERKDDQVRALTLGTPSGSEAEEPDEVVVAVKGRIRRRGLIREHEEEEEVRAARARKAGEGRLGGMVKAWST